MNEKVNKVKCTWIKTIQTQVLSFTIGNSHQQGKQQNHRLNPKRTKKKTITWQAWANDGSIQPEQHPKTKIFISTCLLLKDHNFKNDKKYVMGSCNTYLAIYERLKACHNSNYNGSSPCSSILMFQCPKSGLTCCLAHHNYFSNPSKWKNNDVPRDNESEIWTLLWNWFWRIEQ